MKLTEKYDKIDKTDKNHEISNESYAILEVLEKILDKLENLRLNG